MIYLSLSKLICTTAQKDMGTKFSISMSVKIELDYCSGPILAVYLRALKRPEFGSRVEVGSKLEWRSRSPALI